MLHPDILRVIASKDEIENMVKRMGKSITDDYKSKELVVVGVLKGSFMFLADLARHIEIDFNIDFISVSSYGFSTKSTGVVRIIKDLDIDITNKDVLIAEDIIDTGLTLSYIRDMLSQRGVLSIKTAAAFDKPSRREIEINADYAGITVPDEFIVGYGLDYNEKYRNLPYAGILKQEMCKKQ